MKHSRLKIPNNWHTIHLIVVNLMCWSSNQLTNSSCSDFSLKKRNDKYIISPWIWRGSRCLHPWVRTKRAKLPLFSQPPHSLTLIISLSLCVCVSHWGGMWNTADCVLLCMLYTVQRFNKNHVLGSGFTSSRVSEKTLVFYTAAQNAHLLSKMMWSLALHLHYQSSQNIRIHFDSIQTTDWIDTVGNCVL